MIDPDSIKDASEDSDGKDKGWDVSFKKKFKKNCYHYLVFGFKSISK